jgi:NAD(P)H-dependent FMN reductase
VLSLLIIVASTRPGRVGAAVGEWFREAAERHGGFDVSVADLAEVGLPFLDEPAHPRLQRYTQPHTRAWSETVAAADAYVFVTPEYNHGSPPSLLNALDFLYNEWNYKPAAFVSYGGISGGLRSVQQTKLVALGLKMAPIVEGVPIPFVAKQIGEDGRFRAEETHEKAARATLIELARWAEALRPLRG